ncbi:MAG TPA: 50S ribosomal protein L25 [Candidatus Udaeobacter sp.]|nr:50S ribosomal protein L25 [Candidatus Udaeobacter sp.]
MATMTLKAHSRGLGRKGPSRRLRTAGDVPGIVYGHGFEPQPVAFSAAEFDALLRHRSGTMIIDLQLEGAKDGDRLTVIREIQRNPLNGRVLHVDLQRISLKEKVHVQVPLHVMGVAPGVKDDGGILEYPLRSLDVKCFPNEIPDHFEIDISALKIGDAIHVRDVPIDHTKFDVLSEPEMVVVTVSAPRVLKTEADVAAEAAAVTEGAAAAAAEAAEDEKKPRAGKDKDKDKD